MTFPPVSAKMGCRGELAGGGRGRVVKMLAIMGRARV
jgi:hypothetical protein